MKCSFLAFFYALDDNRVHILVAHFPRSSCGRLRETFAGLVEEETGNGEVLGLLV